jgi:hypothetical protein
LRNLNVNFQIKLIRKFVENSEEKMESVNTAPKPRVRFSPAIEAILGDVAKTMIEKTTSEEYFYWLFFGRVGYIGSTTFLRILPWHDFYYHLFRTVLAASTIWFLCQGPLVRMVYFSVAIILASIFGMAGAMVFMVRKTREIFVEQGFGFWFYYYSRSSCTM